MPDQSPAAEVAFDEYPNVDFTTRIRVAVPSLNGHAPKPPRPLSRWAKAFRFFRRLVRQRQESAAVKSVKWQWREDVSQEKRRAEAAQKAAASGVASVRSDAAKEIASLAKRIESRDRALDELRQKMERQIDQLQQTIAAREKDIKTHVELEIPMLKRELQVKDQHIIHLEAVLEKKLSYEEAQIALHNKLVVDAETAADQLRQSAYLAERGR